MATIHSRWIKSNPFTDTEECENCGANIVSSELETPFCPWCGAKMNENFNRVLKILKEFAFDYYNFEFKDDTALYCSSNYVIEDDQIVFNDCIYFNSIGNGEEISIYELTENQAENIHIIRLYNKIGGHDEVVFM